jgi:hypothetical protein
LLDNESKRVGFSFELLPIQERIQQYREMADATFLKAQKTDDPAVRLQYFDLATRWHALAQQLEDGNLDPEALPESNSREQDNLKKSP